MILNKLQSLSWPRLLHVALSLLCVLALVLGLASGALAASGDASGCIYDFPVLCMTSTGGISQFGVSSSAPGFHCPFSGPYTSLTTCCSFFVVLPFPLSADGSFVNGLLDEMVINNPDFSYNHFYLRCFDSQFNQLAYRHAYGTVSEINFVVPSGTQILNFYFTYNRSSIQQNVGLLELDSGTFEYHDFSYDTSSGGGNYDPSLDQDILSGITALAQSLLDLETGPYYGVSGVTVDQNGDLQHSLTQNASLEDLLNALGIAGTDTNHVIRGIYNNFGSYFTLYSIDDSTSSTTQVYRGLPQYVNALGQSVTDGINRLQRDHDLLYQQASGIEDALYVSTFDPTPEKWSVAEWLRGIFTSINDFISSFWSPAETDLKEAAEAGMQEAADRGIAGSADQVGDMDDLGSGFSSFGSTGNVGAGDLLDSLTSGDYSFFSQTTLDNLSLHPPVSSTRGFRSAPFDQVEYVDELSRNRDLLQEVLGLP